MECDRLEALAMQRALDGRRNRLLVRVAETGLLIVNLSFLRRPVADLLAKALADVLCFRYGTQGTQLLFLRIKEEKRPLPPDVHPPSFKEMVFTRTCPSTDHAPGATR
jgi:hypothetical protein